MQLRKWQSDWEGLAIKIVDTTNENYDASWVQDLIKHRFYSWGGRSSIEVFEGAGWDIFYRGIQGAGVGDLL